VSQVRLRACDVAGAKRQEPNQCRLRRTKPNQLGRRVLRDWNDPRLAELIELSTPANLASFEVAIVLAIATPSRQFPRAPVRHPGLDALRHETLGFSGLRCQATYDT